MLPTFSLAKTQEKSHSLKDGFFTVIDYSTK